MPTTTQQRLNVTTWSLLALLGLIWGGSFFFGRVAVPYVPPLTLAFLRLSIAALALHLYLHGRMDLYRSLRQRWAPFLLLGLINNAIPHTLILFGQTQIGAGLAAILNATTPIWTMLIANRLTADEKLSPAKLGGTLLGLAGTAVLVGPSAFQASDIPLWAMILPVMAAISYGFAATYGKRFRDLPAPVTATGQLTASALIMLPTALIVDQSWQIPFPPLNAVAAILALALLSTAFGYILFFRIMALAGATNTSLVTLLVPPSAILLGALFLGETLTLTDLAGMLLIAVALLVLDGRVRWPQRSAV
ncbi:MULTISPECIES: DMT family transporter [Alphaproteobacteria]|uniref:ABC transporter permease n=2 Tax=Alphaproteobacteria TaxID=28211 RepID=A0A512HED9_9HYPH|nr:MULTISPECIES: DMT family transporter [Alphaproteobacteria]GEO83816.1 ABC transporter permease [Ciceribacter naphthalenivorans]GLR21306.1 ABC transporter permease [Ciceribacter naphthalenivorans]GLT04162.1 ABC transporter permease [Sphingomonas psychrolutea]